MNNTVKLCKAVIMTQVMVLSVLIPDESPAVPGESEGPVISSIRKAVTQNDTGPFIKALHYPITLCLNGTPERFQNEDELKTYTMADFLGSGEIVAPFAEFMKGPNPAEGFEISYGGKQVFGLGYSADDNTYVFISYTEDGIYEIKNGKCGEMKFPKPVFCNDPEKDAFISMLAHHSTAFHNRGTYESFKDGGYSRIVMTPSEKVAGGAVDFILDGKKLDLKRDPKSYDEAPVYSDETADYMILSPGEFDEIYCYYPGRCRPIPFIHVFKKLKGAETCEDGELVLAEKYSLNFCPYDSTMSSEIRLFSEGFAKNGEPLVSKVFADEGGTTSVRFESRSVEEKIPEEDGGGTYDRDFTVAVLKFNGKEHETVLNDSESIVFRTGDREILAVPEGDYDAVNGDFPNLGCADEDVCVQAAEKLVLFIRDDKGSCERRSLKAVRKAVKRNEQIGGKTNEKR